MSDNDFIMGTQQSLNSSSERSEGASVRVGQVSFFVFCLIVAFFAGMQVGFYHGGFRGDVFYEGDSSPLAFSASSTSDLSAQDDKKVLTLSEEGKAVYSNCVPCHQASGMGLAGQFPSLVGTDLVIGSEKRLIAILLKGIQGPLKVGESVFNGAMPPWEKSLSNRKIASVASFIRSTWGNSSPEIDEGKVDAVKREFAKRDSPWTEAELLAIPADAPISVESDSTKSSSVTESAKLSLSSDALGKETYLAVCAACHQPNGKGLAPVFPTLERTDYVQGSPERLIAIVLKGIIGPIQVSGVGYNNVMPPQEAMLSDQKIAAVLSYVRSSFGNSSDAVSADLVQNVRKSLIERKTPWSEKELIDFVDTKK